ncbi:TPA: dihydrofolate reductase [Pseudomonas aeruginosa]|nr:dihydrofolate reductase [Pseudomonas aeruginosa]
MQPHLIYYVATSLDGFIARPDGSVDWLDRFAEGGNDHGYNGFYQGIDGLLMGRGTYDIMRGFGDWPYPGKPCQVLTRNPRESAVEGVELRHDTPQEGLARLGEQGCRRVWLAGGGSLAGSCLAAGLLDEVIVSVIPQLVGAGIPLFAGGRERRLQLLEQHGYNSGIVQMRYQVIAEDDPQ